MLPLDSPQGPEAFVTPPEPLTGNAVLWVIPRMPNAERARCWADMDLRDGVLVPPIWPCASGVRVGRAAPERA
ncbi:MAG: hypothetical protein WCJ55_20005 [Chloroflexales bacterium]